MFFVLREKNLRIRKVFRSLTLVRLSEERNLLFLNNKEKHKKALESTKKHKSRTLCRGMEVTGVIDPLAAYLEDTENLAMIRSLSFVNKEWNEALSHSRCKEAAVKNVQKVCSAFLKDLCNLHHASAVIAEETQENMTIVIRHDLLRLAMATSRVIRGFKKVGISKKIAKQVVITLQGLFRQRRALFFIERFGAPRVTLRFLLECCAQEGVSRRRFSGHGQVGASEPVEADGAGEASEASGASGESGAGEASEASVVSNVGDAGNHRRARRRKTPVPCVNSRYEFELSLSRRFVDFSKIKMTEETRPGDDASSPPNE